MNITIQALFIIAALMNFAAHLFILVAALSGVRASQEEHGVSTPAAIVASMILLIIGGLSFALPVGIAASTVFGR